MSTLDDIIAQLERNAIDYGTDDSGFPNVWNQAAPIKETTQNFEEFSEDIKKHPWKLMSKGKSDK